MEEIDLFGWVETASGNDDQNRVVHILLHGIGSSDGLRTTMIMKGGNLLGIRHSSTRYTGDVDFSTAQKFKDFGQEAFEEELNQVLISAAGDLGYTLQCWVQKTVVQPHAEGTFPTLQVKIGYADTQNPKEKKFVDRRQSPKILKIDYSFNEVTYNHEIIKLSNDSNILAYSIIDIVAEKIRSVLQQVVRKRNREQDIYDLWYLLTSYTFNTTQKREILSSLRKKSEGKELDSYLHADALAEPEIKARSSERYGDLKDTVKDLPDFEVSYGVVEEFFKSLPWSTNHNKR